MADDLDNEEVETELTDEDDDESDITEKPRKKSEFMDEEVFDSFA